MADTWKWIFFVICLIMVFCRHLLLGPLGLQDGHQAASTGLYEHPRWLLWFLAEDYWCTHPNRRLAREQRGQAVNRVVFFINF